MGGLRSYCKLANGSASCPADCGERCRGISQQARLSTSSRALQVLEAEANGAAQATWTLTNPPFIMAIDVDESQQRGRVRSEVSHSVKLAGVHEARYTQYWRMLTARCCAEGGLVLDVGANLGYYSLFAAALGCRVIAWEPVPRFRAFLEASAALNNLSHRISVRSTVAADAAQSSVTMRVPRHNWDISSVGGLNLIPSQRLRYSSAESFEASAEAIDGVVLTEQACAMKVDTEGFEPAVMRGAARLLRRHPPHTILLEYTPGSVERSAQGGLPDALERPPVRYADFPGMLSLLQAAGYRIWQLSHNMKYLSLSGGTIASEREVLPASIAAEARNAENVRRGFAGRGFAFPWDVHPHALRASFEYNTDLLLLHQSTNWTARGLASVPIRTLGPVGVTDDSPYGLGRLLQCWKLGGAERIGRLCELEDGGGPRQRATKDERRAKRADAIARAAKLAERRQRATPRHVLLAKTLGVNASVMKRHNQKANQACWWERTGCFFLRQAEGDPCDACFGGRTPKRAASPACSRKRCQRRRARLGRGSGEREAGAAGLRARGPLGLAQGSTAW